MTKVQSGDEILLKVSTPTVGRSRRTNVTDIQTDGFAIAKTRT